MGNIHLITQGEEHTLYVQYFLLSKLCYIIFIFVNIIVYARVDYIMSFTYNNVRSIERNPDMHMLN